MKYLLIVSLASLSAMASMSLQDCNSFTQIVNESKKNELAVKATVCKNLYINSLNEEVYKLDKAQSRCQEQLEVVKDLTGQAGTFFQSSTRSLDAVYPDSKIQENMDNTILDMAYALNDMDEPRDCIFDEFVKVKADAQVKSIVLGDTQFIDTKDL